MTCCRSNPSLVDPLCIAASAKWFCRTKSYKSTIFINTDINKNIKKRLKNKLKLNENNFLKVNIYNIFQMNAYACVSDLYLFDIFASGLHL